MEKTEHFMFIELGKYYEVYDRNKVVRDSLPKVLYSNVTLMADEPESEISIILENEKKEMRKKLM